MIATLRNMRECEQHNVRAMMLDVSTGETFSATPGDYWYTAEDEVFTGEDGQPLILVTRHTEYRPVELGATATTAAS